MKVEVRCKKSPMDPDNSIVLDGHDITKYCTGMTFTVHVGMITEATIHLHPSCIEMDADLVARIIREQEEHDGTCRI